jgi:hypothetical protein
MIEAEKFILDSGLKNGDANISLIILNFFKKIGKNKHMKAIKKI